MKRSIRKFLGSVLFIFTISIPSFGAHIVGGDITVKWISGNNFEITLQFFRDCNSTTNFDDPISLGLFDAVTNKADTISLSAPVITKIILGNACYTPTTCIELAVYKKTIVIPNNVNGYYISYLRCCRNAGIVNINAADSSGYVMYCEIPNPSLHNSSPTFNSVPDGFMCGNYPNMDSFTCTDADGDILKYSFSTPLSCSANSICSVGNANPGINRRPYGTIAWANGYSLANIMGDPNMAINPATGVVNTTPPYNGIYVFCVKVEEYRAGIKIGEIQRDFQFQILGCSILNVGFSPTPQVCSGNSVTLTANGASSAFKYYWNPGGQTTSAIVVADTASGIYNYTVTATNGLCISKSTAAVIINENPAKSTVTPNNVLCNQGVGSAQVNPAGGIPPYSYNWLTTPAQTSNLAVNLLPGTYSVIVKDKNSCTSIKTVSITEPPPLSSSVSSTSLSCNSVPNGTATAAGAGGTPGYTFSWNTAPTQTTSTATGLSAATYTVTITDLNGCKTSVPVSISQPTALILTATPSGVSCGGTAPTGIGSANTIGGIPPYQYNWSNSQTTAIISHLTGGTYFVVTKDANGCTQQQNITIPLAIRPIAGFTYTHQLSCEGNSTQFSNTSTQATSYVWDFGDGNASVQQNSPLHIFPGGGTFVITLIADNPPCKDTLAKKIVAEDMDDFHILPANVFTPNGDLDNSCFTPAICKNPTSNSLNCKGPEVEKLKSCIRLEIYDRWGVKMFESIGSNNCWNGRNMNDSTPATAGIYYYVATLGKTVLKGYLTLLR
jgi:CHU_C Type IX secretion signal domain/PKD domain/SprB repeat